MGRRSRKRAQQGGGAAAATSDYTADDGSVLTLRDQLSAGTLKKLGDLDAKPAADAEDRWQRRVEFLFERLAVSWEIGGVAYDAPKDLLARLRAATPDERRFVRDTLRAHCAEWFPEVQAP